jgi:hypothetical protein
LGNVLGRESSPDIDVGDVDVYTSNLYELNIKAQDAVREFALHDIDDREGLETKRIIMHDSFTELYDEIASFIEQIMVQDFDIAYVREKATQVEGEIKEQMEEALKELVNRAQRNQAEVWMAKVLAWLHQEAAASGPFTEEENKDNQKRASSHLAAVYTMLEKPFSAIPAKSDGTQKLRRVALSHMAYNLLKSVKEEDDPELLEIQGKNKIAEAEFFDEFLNELIGQESTFRQAFNPFDELLWRDILSSFIFEHATDLYNEAIPFFEKSGGSNKQKMSMIKAWKQNTAGLSEVYLAMTYNDIADAQMRAGNLEDASKLYGIASDAFGRAEKCFGEVISLQPNAEQSKNDKEQKKAQSNFCKAEASVEELSELIKVNNRKAANQILKEIFKSLKKAEKLSKTRELSGAIQEDLKTFSFVEDLLKKKSTDMSSVLDQIVFARDLRKTGLMQNVNKALDEAAQHLAEEPAEALEAIREALDSLGILLSLEAGDEDIGALRNKTLALLNNVKYVIQFQVSSQLQQNVNFIMSRILENLHAAEAASYYKVIGEKEKAAELTDMGRLALATAYASEAQVFARQSEQWAFRSQIERANSFRKLEDEISEFDEDDSLGNVIETHDSCIEKIRQSIASFSAAANELEVVKDKNIREKNNVDAQVKQLQGVVMKLLGDLSRMEGAKSDYMAEFMYRKGKKSKAQRHYSDANDQLRKAVGNYAVAAQVFQQLGDAQSAQSIDAKRQTADLLARSVWDNRQRLERDQEPNYKGDAELMALYQGSTGS